MQLASTVSNRTAAITHIANHVREWDLEHIALVPDQIDMDEISHSDQRFNLLTHHTKIPLQHVQVWQHFINGFSNDEDLDSNRLLRLYFFDCLDGPLLAEVTEEYYDSQPECQGAATLIKLAMTKLDSNSFACQQSYQSIIMFFDLSVIPDENVSVAASWLKAVIKALQITDSIPSKALDCILNGMQRSSSKTFNMHCAILLSQVDPIVHYQGFDYSEKYQRQIFDALDSCTSKYRDAVQSRTWPKGAPSSSTSSSSTALVANTHANRAYPDSTSNAILNAIAKASPEQILALLTQRDSRSSSGRTENFRLCYNPNCRSRDHVARDCPVAWPKDHPNNRSDSRGNFRGSSRDRGRSRERQYDSSRGNSRGSSRNFRSSSRDGRAVSRDRSRRPGTPGPASARSQPKDPPKVAFANNVTASAPAPAPASVDDDDSVTSTYNDNAYNAFVLRTKQLDLASKD